MEKFGMNFGGGPSKKELLDIIEGQKKQLTQYQTRFKDVVRAYKSLLKEKEALEASLKVLTVSQEADLHLQNEKCQTVSAANRLLPDAGDDKSSVHSEDSLGTAASADTATSLTSSSTKGEANDEDRNLVDIMTTDPSQKFEESNGSESGVSCSSGEQQKKSRMEASFQADRKRMKQELDELNEKLEERKKKVWKRVATAASRRACLRQDAELKLEEIREETASKISAVDLTVHYESQIKQLSKEMDELRRKLQTMEEERNRPDPRVGEMQQQISDLKLHFQLQLQSEMKKVAQAEEQLKQHAQKEEERIASLEGQVSELSELLGSYEKAKQKDQQTIQKLRDRILQLDMENKTLAIAATIRSSVDLTIDESNLDVNVLKDKIEKLKKLLVIAKQKSPQSFDFEKQCDLDLTDSTELSDGEKASVIYYQQELKQLKEEFERYKMRAQVVLKNKTSKDGNITKELEDTREQISELKEKYILLRLSCDEMENNHKQELEAKQQYITNLQQTHKQDLEKLQAGYRERSLKLEEELHKQRDRTLALLAEKDQELDRLKSISFSYALSGLKSTSENNIILEREVADKEISDDSTQDIIAEALKLAGPNEPTLLLYAEQLARKEVEIISLRKQKHRLEGDFHQLQNKFVATREQYEEELSVLKDQLQKSARDLSREGANLEYLKNIIYKYLTLQDFFGRQQTLTAILTILHFSPQEKQAVMKLQGNSWWGSGSR
uniref:GRIP and coiled-coil domain-containing protein 1 n=1 Tax=Erpetoichthys calabaricus TaxID=27687 RepID=A0A8C4RVS2_ERPCA